MEKENIFRGKWDNNEKISWLIFKYKSMIIEVICNQAIFLFLNKLISSWVMKDYCLRQFLPFPALSHPTNANCV